MTKAYTVPKVVRDVDDMLTMMGESFLSKELTFFKGEEARNDLFNAYWNKQYTHNCDEALAKKISECLEYGQKIFNVKMYKTGNMFYALKETDGQVVFMEYKLYQGMGK